MAQDDSIWRDLSDDRAFGELRSFAQFRHIDKNEAVFWIAAVDVNVEVQLRQDYRAVGANFLKRRVEITGRYRAWILGNQNGSYGTGSGLVDIARGYLLLLLWRVLYCRRDLFFETGLS